MFISEPQKIEISLVLLPMSAQCIEWGHALQADALNSLMILPQVHLRNVSVSEYFSPNFRKETDHILS